MSRPALRLFGAATFLLLTLIPAAANTSEIDFLGLGHGTSNAGTTLTSLYNAGSSIYTQSVASVLAVARHDRGQDQITAGVSEPSTLLLVGVAFLMFAKRARRTSTSDSSSRR